MYVSYGFAHDISKGCSVANVVTRLLERTCYVDKQLQAADQFVVDSRDLAALCRPRTAVSQMEDPHNDYTSTHTKCIIELSSCLGNTSCDSSATLNQILNA